MKQTINFSLLLLACFILSGCGGGGNSDSGSQTPTPQNPNQDANPQADLLDIRYSNTSFDLKNHQLAPFNKEADVIFSTENNDPRVLLTVRNTEDFKHYVGIVFNTENSKQIDGILLTYFTAGKWLNISCHNDCAKSFSYKVAKEKDGKTYFSLTVNAKKIPVETNNDEVVAYADISGIAKYPVHADWAVFQSPRFPKKQYDGYVALGGQQYNIKSSRIYTDIMSSEKRLFYIFTLNDKNNTTFQVHNIDRDNLPRYDITGEVALGKYFWYNANNQDGVDAIKGLFNHHDGYFNLILDHQKLKNNFDFIPESNETEQDVALDVNFRVTQPLVSIQLDDGEVFKSYHSEFYTRGDLNYYRFHDFEDQSREFNVIHETLLNKFYLVYQKPRKDVINYNIHENINCGKNNVKGCEGITLSQDGSRISLNNVKLDDGRIINGKVINIAAD